MLPLPRTRTRCCFWMVGPPAAASVCLIGIQAGIMIISVQMHIYAAEETAGGE